jgi:hypothetical protein
MKVGFFTQAHRVGDLSAEAADILLPLGGREAFDIATSMLRQQSDPRLVMKGPTAVLNRRGPRS